MPHQPTEETLKLVERYGFSAVVAVVLLLAGLTMCALLIRWILKSADAREARYAQERQEAIAERKDALKESEKREDKSERREEALTKILTDGLTRLASTIQTCTETLNNVQAQQQMAISMGQARYDNMQKAQEMQRVEHANMLAEIRGLRDNTKDFECRALTVIPQPK